MSQSEVQRFASALRVDPALLAKVRKLATRPVSDVVILAKAHGYDFTVADAQGLIRSKARAMGEALTDERLDAVTTASFSAKSNCICSAGRQPATKAAA